MRLALRQQLGVASSHAFGECERNARPRGLRRIAPSSSSDAQFSRGRIVQLRQVEAEFGPLLARRQAVAREGVDVRRIRVVGRRIASVHVTAARTA